MNWALTKYGDKIALQIWAVALVSIGCGFSSAFKGVLLILSQVVFTAPLAYYIKPRIPVTNSKAARNEPIYFGFFKQPIFWFMECGSIIQGIGYFIPTIFLPCGSILIFIILIPSSIVDSYKY